MKQRDLGSGEGACRTPGKRSPGAERGRVVRQGWVGSEELPAEVSASAQPPVTTASMTRSCSNKTAKPL